MSWSNSCVQRELAARDVLRDVAQAPDRQRIFVGDEAERAQPRALEPAREQHAERLVREPAFERIADEIVLVAARKRLDQELAGAGRSERHSWSSSHSRTWSGSRARRGIGDDAAHAVGKIGRERKLARPHRPALWDPRRSARET